MSLSWNLVGTIGYIVKQKFSISSFFPSKYSLLNYFYNKENTEKSFGDKCHKLLKLGINMRNAECWMHDRLILAHRPLPCNHRKKRISIPNSILLLKLFWPTVRKKKSSDREKLLQFEAEFAKILRSLKQFIQTVKGQNNFW